MSETTETTRHGLIWERIEAGHYIGRTIPDGPGNPTYRVLRGDHPRHGRLFPTLPASRDHWRLISPDGIGHTFDTMRDATRGGDEHHATTVTPDPYATNERDQKEADALPPSDQDSRTLFLSLLSDTDRMAYELGVSEAEQHRTEGVTRELAYAYFSDAVRELGPNRDEAPNRHSLYWHGVSDTLGDAEAAAVKARQPNAWRDRAGLALSPRHPRFDPCDPSHTLPGDWRECDSPSCQAQLARDRAEGINVWSDQPTANPPRTVPTPEDDLDAFEHSVWKRLFALAEQSDHVGNAGWVSARLIGERGALGRLYELGMAEYVDTDRGDYYRPSRPTLWEERGLSGGRISQLLTTDGYVRCEAGPYDCHTSYDRTDTRVVCCVACGSQSPNPGRRGEREAQGTHYARKDVTCPHRIA